MARAMGYPSHMGRGEHEPAKPARRPEEGRETIHGMGLSSEHDAGEVQEVDSREED